MANPKNVETETKQSNPKQGNIEAEVQGSIAKFFNQLTNSIEQIGNGTAKRYEDPAVDKRFEIYSQAFQGFAQNNVSKPEGFSLKVKVDAGYDKFLEEIRNKENRKNLELT